MTLKVYVTPVTAFEQNCSVLVCERTLAAAVVDPGGDLGARHGPLGCSIPHIPRRVDGFLRA